MNLMRIQKEQETLPADQAAVASSETGEFNDKIPDRRTFLQLLAGLGLTVVGVGSSSAEAAEGGVHWKESPRMLAEMFEAIEAGKPVALLVGFDGCPNCHPASVFWESHNIREYAPNAYAVTYPKDDPKKPNVKPTVSNMFDLNECKGIYLDDPGVAPLLLFLDRALGERASGKKIIPGRVYWPAVQRMFKGYDECTRDALAWVKANG